MKKIILLTLTTILTVLLFTSCSNKTEIIRYKIDDFPANRIYQSFGTIIESERTEDPILKYKYTIKCDIGNNDFTTVVYDNKYMYDGTFVHFIYAKENNNYHILNINEYKEKQLVNKTEEANEEEWNQ